MTPSSRVLRSGRKLSIWMTLKEGASGCCPSYIKDSPETGATVPQLNKLKGIYRQSLYQNSMLFHKAFALLAELAKMNVPFIVLKGAALVAAYYEDIGARPMSDVDFLIREEDVERTLRYLSAQGWEHKDGFAPKKAVKHIHSLDLQNREGCALDVHWRVFYHCAWEGAEQSLWEQTEEIVFKGLTVRILNPTEQVLHNCAHGVRWNALSSIRWVVDVLKILEKRPGEINWDLLVVRAKERKISLTMQHALGFLKSGFHADIPEDVLNALAETPKDRQEIHLYRVLISEPSFVNSVYKKWLVHSYSLGDLPFWKKAALFPGFATEAFYQLTSYIRKRIA